MHLTVLRMLTSTSLQAFSGATTTAPLARPTATTPTSPLARLARAQPDTTSRQAAPIPGTPPAIPPPRGSLLNLSI